MFTRTFLSLILAAGVALTPASSDAQAPIVVVQDQPFDRIGFLGRVTLGGGYQYSDGHMVDIYGPSLTVSATGGVSVTPELTIQGEAWASVAVGPTVESADSVELLSTDTQLILTGVGPGFTYFFPGMQAFLSASIGFTIAQLEIDGFVTGETNIGWGSHIMLGADWWIAPRLTVGLAGNILFQMNQDSGGWLNSYVAGLSVIFSRQ